MVIKIRNKLYFYPIVTPKIVQDEIWHTESVSYSRISILKFFTIAVVVLKGKGKENTLPKTVYKHYLPDLGYWESKIKIISGMYYYKLTSFQKPTKYRILTSKLK